MSNLKTEQNTKTIEKLVLKDAWKFLHSRTISAFYEHGQWWIENRKTGAQWSVVDVADSSGRFQRFDFEQVTCGEER